jgi:hypothetical protein
MKSKKVKELLQWIKEQIKELNIVDEYNPVIPLVEIAELEMANSPLLEQKVATFKAEQMQLFIEEVKTSFIFDCIYDKTLDTQTIDNPIKIPIVLENFVRIEYELVDQVLNRRHTYPEWKIVKQSLQHYNDRKIDILEIAYKLTPEQKDFKKRFIHFDITDNFAAKTSRQN